MSCVLRTELLAGSVGVRLVLRCPAVPGLVVVLPASTFMPGHWWWGLCAVPASSWRRGVVTVAATPWRCLLPRLPPSSRLGGGGEALRLLPVLDASSRCLFGGGDLRGSFSLSFPFPWLLEPDGSSGLPPAAALQALDFDSNFPPLASAMSARESARACCSRALRARIDA